MNCSFLLVSHLFNLSEEDDESQAVDVELMEIGSTAEIEIPAHGEVTIIKLADDQQLLNEEIKEEEIEDANASQDIKSQGKRLLLKVLRSQLALVYSMWDEWNLHLRVSYHLFIRCYC